MLTKLKNNNKGGADLQFAVATFLFMFVVCMGLLLDFWYVSSAKISVLKAVESVELYCLVTAAPTEVLNSGKDLNDLWKVDLRNEQAKAVVCTESDLAIKLRTLPYLNDTKDIKIEGGSQFVGQMSVRTHLKYRVKTMIKSPAQIFNFMRSKDMKITAINWVPLTVTAKLVPMLEDLHINK